MIKIHIAFYLAAGFMLARCEQAAATKQPDSAGIVTVAIILLVAGFIFEQVQSRKPKP